METLAAVIVSALVSGSANVAKEAVSDAYSAAKVLLKEYVPRFDSDTINSEAESSKVEELANRLNGLTDVERKELVEKMEPLAEAMGARDQSEKLSYIIKNISAGKDADIDLAGKGSHEIDGVHVGERVSIKTRS